MITLLHTQKELGYVAGKTHKWVENKWVTEDYDAGTWYSWTQRDASSIYDLLAILQEYSVRNDTFLIRGRILDEENPKCRRIYLGEEPYIGSYDCRWVCLDYDNVPAKKSVGELVIRLPECFHGVSCIWQRSSSYKIKETPGKVSGHLWFWLDRPVSDKSLKEYLKVHAPEVDVSLFNPVQPHFIANPVFYKDEVQIPDIVSERLLFQGEFSRNQVTLPSEVLNSEEWEKQEDDKRKAYQARVRATQSYSFNSGDMDTLLRNKYAVRAVEASLDRISSSVKGERNKTAWSSACTLGNFWEYLDYGQRDQMMYEMVSRITVALEDESDHYCLNMVERAIKVGQGTPVDLSHIVYVDKTQRLIDKYGLDPLFGGLGERLLQNQNIVINKNQNRLPRNSWGNIYNRLKGEKR